MAASQKDAGKANPSGGHGVNEPATTEMLLGEARERAGRYLQEIGVRAVVPTALALDDIVRLGGPLPQTGTDALSLLQLIDDVGAPATVASAGPRYFGFVTGGALPAALAANWLVSTWDQNAFSIASSPLGAAIEALTLEWLAELFGLPADCGGALGTGASMANFTALAAARHAVLRRAGWDIAQDGLNGAPEVTIVVGAEVHAVLIKALRLLGFGMRHLVRVPTDGQGRMRVDAFPDLSGPAIVCLQAGNVNTGAFDPAVPIIDRAREAGAWIHIDGAFGLWAAVAPARAHLMAGYDRADSWAVDGHKWLNVPYDCGITLVRDQQALRDAMAISAAYLPPGAERDPIDYSPEASRRMRGVEVWAALKSLGRQGMAELVERNCRQAAQFAAGLQAAGFAILNEVVLNQVLVSFGDADMTNRVIAAVQADGTCWCGGTVWQDRAAMRISVSSWATTDEDVVRSIDAIIRVARAEGAG